MFVYCVENVKNTDTLCGFKEVNYAAPLATTESEPKFEFVKNLDMFYGRSIFQGLW